MISKGHFFTFVITRPGDVPIAGFCSPGIVTHDVPGTHRGFTGIFLAGFAPP